MRISKSERILHYVILIILAILFVLPLLWMIFSSLDTAATQSFKIPEEFTIDNYTSILNDPTIIRSFVVSLILSGGQSIIVVAVALLAAYPLSRYRASYRRPFMYTILFLTSLPMTAVIVPVFQMFLMFNFIDKMWAVMLLMSAFSLPYAVWMMKNFMDSVPVSLEESAWIDGASVWEGIRRVVVPLMKPGILTVFIFTFTRSWGNFLVPFILFQSPDKMPAAVTIYQFFGNYGLINYGQLTAFSILYSIPAVVLYFFAQRYMSEGFGFGGAIKG